MTSRGLLLSLLLIHSVESFVPKKWIATLTSTAFSHEDITVEALLRVSAAHFNDTGQLSANHKAVAFSARSLIRAVYGSNANVDEFEGVLNKIASANAAVDFDEDTKSNPVYHVDAETFEKSHKRLQERFSAIVTGINSEDYSHARTLMGQALHTLQDFYSHSNWIEMGNELILFDLGLPGKGLGIRVAGEDEQTCRNCEKKRREDIGGILQQLAKGGFGLSSVSGGVDDVYICEDNLVITDGLTSGYTNSAGKPEKIGKCSHGGVLDGTSDDFAVGGINKDSSADYLSPHYYLHSEAVRMAIDATTFWVNEIRVKCKKKNFGYFLSLHEPPKRFRSFSSSISGFQRFTIVMSLVVLILQ